VIALLATTLAISDSATAINLTIGNDYADNSVAYFGGEAIGQSFINDTNDPASILLNDWTFSVGQYNPPFFMIDEPLSGTAILNVYAGIGTNPTTLIGSSSAYTTLTDSVGRNAAKWTFTGGLSIISNQPYTAAFTSSNILSILSASNNPYANGVLTQSVSGNLTSTDTVFSANFSPAAATPVPFEFEGTGGLLVLGGGWLLRRHLKKRAKKD